LDTLNKQIKLSK